MKITNTQKLGQHINDVINAKAAASDVKFMVKCMLTDYKSFKKSCIKLGYSF